MARTIVVTGKGGVGKTVVAALIVKHLREHATGPILAIDADPDSNLGTVLGVPVSKTLGDVREETLAEIKDLPAGMSKATHIEMGLHNAIIETEKVDFLVMGRSEGPGCYCYINHLLRKFTEDVLPSYEWLVMDSEAGMEHLSRRTTTAADHLIVVVNGSPLAIDCAERIDAVLSSVKNQVRDRRLLINNVRADRVETVRERASGLNLTYLGCIPHDDALEDAVFQAASLYELASGPATLRMNEIMAQLGA